MKKIIHLGIFIFLFSNNQAVIFSEIYLTSKDELAIEDSISNSSLDNRQLDVSIIFSEEDKTMCSTLYSDWNNISETELLEKVKIINQKIFKKSKRNEGLYTGTLVSHLFYAISEKCFYLIKLSSMLKKSSLLSEKLNWQNQLLNSLENIYHILKILIDLDFDSYSFGVFFELIEFGSQKVGNKILVQDYYFKLFEKIKKHNNFYIFLNVARYINLILRINNPIINFLTKTNNNSIEELLLNINDQNRNKYVSDNYVFLINHFSNKLQNYFL